jgi:hypothetical protein
VSPARLIELVDARRQHSTRHYQGTLTRLQRWYDSYRGVWSGRLNQFRNNVTIPFTFAMIQSDVPERSRLYRFVAGGGLLRVTP